MGKGWRIPSDVADELGGFREGGPAVVSVLDYAPDGVHQAHHPLVSNIRDGSMRQLRDSLGDLLLPQSSSALARLFARFIWSCFRWPDFGRAWVTWARDPLQDHPCYFLTVSEHPAAPPGHARTVCLCSIDREGHVAGDRHIHVPTLTCDPDEALAHAVVYEACLGRIDRVGGVDRTIALAERMKATGDAERAVREEEAHQGLPRWEVRHV